MSLLIGIRTALRADFPAMSAMDLAANATHPVYIIPWKTAIPGAREAREAFILDRYNHLLHRSRNPNHGESTFLVAVAGAGDGDGAGAGAGAGDGDGTGDEIVGYLLYRKSRPADAGADGADGDGGGEEEEEWNPRFAEGTDVRFFEKVFGEVRGARGGCELKGCWELEGFAVHPNWQRKGVGSMLVEKFLEAVDAHHAKCYVHSSRVGKQLYEKFGFEVVGVVRVDLGEFGDYEPYVTWDMKREAV